MKRKKIEKGFCYIRILSTIAVVFFHTCGTLQTNQPLFELNEEQNSFFLIAYHMMFWAVPVFFMLSGAVLLDPENEFTEKKYINIFVECLQCLFVLAYPLLF